MPGITTIGRDATANDISLPNAAVSSKHAVLGPPRSRRRRRRNHPRSPTFPEAAGKLCFIRDVHSTNKTRIGCSLEELQLLTPNVNV